MMDNIYAAPNADLATEAKEVKYAGFWVRVGAALIDTVWLLLLLFALGWMIYDKSPAESLGLTGAATEGALDVFLSYILPFLLTISFWHFKSATPGKMIFGVKIVDAKTFGKVSVFRLVVRYFSYYISAFFLALGLLWVGWDKRKQGWHDKIAGTVVIKNN